MNKANSQTALGIILSILVWLAAYCFIYIVFTLASIAQGTNDFLEMLCRELFTSALGGYLALEAVKRLTPQGNWKFIFWSFCIAVFLFMIFVRIIGVIYCLSSGNCTFSWAEQLTTCLAGITAILGAGYSYKMGVAE